MVLRQLGLRQDESLEHVEGVTPPIVVKRAALLGLEQTLGEVDLGCGADVSRRSRLFPSTDISRARRARAGRHRRPPSRVPRTRSRSSLATIPMSTPVSSHRYRAACVWVSPIPHREQGVCIRLRGRSSSLPLREPRGTAPRSRRLASPSPDRSRFCRGSAIAQPGSEQELEPAARSLGARTARVTSRPGRRAARGPRAADDAADFPSPAQYLGH